MRRTVLLFVLPVLLSALLFAGCEDDSNPGDTNDQPYEGHVLVGTWLKLGTSYHYDADDDIEEPSPDSTWFQFNATGVAIYKQALQGGYHQQLYEWSVDDSLLTLTEEMGLNPERRPIEVSEIFTFREAGCCGSAAVITPIRSITHGEITKVYAESGKAGPYCTALYEKLTGIQVGDEPDSYGWLRSIA